MKSFIMIVFLLFGSVIAQANQSSLVVSCKDGDLEKRIIHHVNFLRFEAGKLKLFSMDDSDNKVLIVEYTAENNCIVEQVTQFNTNPRMSIRN